jgi:hypothetical protein
MVIHFQTELGLASLNFLEETSRTNSLEFVHKTRVGETESIERKDSR